MTRDEAMNSAEYRAWQLEQTVKYVIESDDVDVETLLACSNALTAHYFDRCRKEKNEDHK